MNLKQLLSCIFFLMESLSLSEYQKSQVRSIQGLEYCIQNQLQLFVCRQKNNCDFLGISFHIVKSSNCYNNKDLHEIITKPKQRLWYHCVVFQCDFCNFNILDRARGLVYYASTLLTSDNILGVVYIMARAVIPCQMTFSHGRTSIVKFLKMLF